MAGHRDARATFTVDDEVLGSGIQEASVQQLLADLPAREAALKMREWFVTGLKMEVAKLYQAPVTQAAQTAQSQVETWITQNVKDID